MNKIYCILEMFIICITINGRAPNLSTRYEHKLTTVLQYCSPGASFPGTITWWARGRSAQRSPLLSRRKVRSKIRVHRVGIVAYHPNIWRHITAVKESNSRTFEYQANLPQQLSIHRFAVLRYLPIWCSLLVFSCAHNLTL